MKKFKIAGVLVLYNPPADIIDTIEMILNQIDFLIVIDNTETQNKQLSDLIRSYKSVTYLTKGINLGIAGALNWAAKIAINQKYNFLLTLDQDSKLTSNFVVKLINKAATISNIGIISPLHTNKFNTQHADSEIDEVDFVMTSGNLLNLEVFKKIGKFNEDLFIDYVDIEYCFRLNLSKYKVIRSNRVELIHEEANITKEKIFFKTIYPYNHSPLRMYYKTRNRMYLKKKFKNEFPNYFRQESKIFYNNLLKILLFEDFKIKKIMYSLKGLFDYYLGIKGKYNSCNYYDILFKHRFK